MKAQTIRIGGMTCINCQNRIEKKLKGLEGIEEAEVDYSAGTAKITFDEAVISPASIKSEIKSLGYTTPDEESGGRAALQAAGILVIILALASLLRLFSTSSLAASFPLAEEGMGYGMLLVIGLLTSVHCIAVCGGINLSQSLGGGKTPLAPAAASQQSCSASSSASPLPGAPPQTPFMLLLPGVLYNAGRIVSYTAVGFAIGALGSVITVSNLLRNIVFLLAGLFMVIMGLNMLGLFPFLRRLTPKLPQIFTQKIDAQKTGRGPFVIGILNGFMPCGPLQAMQLYALSTGSPIKGGVSMFLFCIGAVPLMFALGAAGGILSGAKGSAFSRRAIQAGAILVAAMGVVMFTNGLSGAGITPASPLSRSSSREGGGVMQNDVQIINSTLLPNRYPAITVQQGIPVRWIIDAPRGSINGCNNRVLIREYGIQHTFKYGENVIEFMPEKSGRFGYSCWMSMIRSFITVLAPGESIADLKEPDVTPKPAGVAIPTDAVAVAQIEDGGRYQSVEINLSGGGFEPAIIAVKRGIRVIWTVNINSFNLGSGSLVFPAYYARIETEQGPNTIRFLPETDFDFSTGDNVFYGYVKVTDDIRRIDMEAVKADVEKHETLIYPQAYFDRGE